MLVFPVRHTYTWKSSILVLVQVNPSSGYPCLAASCCQGFGFREIFETELQLSKNLQLKSKYKANSVYTVLIKEPS